MDQLNEILIDQAISKWIRTNNGLSVRRVKLLSFFEGLKYRRDRLIALMRRKRIIILDKRFYHLRISDYLRMRKQSK